MPAITYTVRSADGRWFNLLYPNQPHWTENPHLSYAYETEEEARTTLSRLIQHGFIPAVDHGVAVMMRLHADLEHSLNAAEGWQRVEIPGHPDRQVFERPLEA